jgi:hypothetical protein
MIIWTAVNFKKLLQLGKEYFWSQPVSCPGCGGLLWGHGYVWRFFLEAPKGCWIKRYCCPDCGKVITMRPIGYWPRFFHDREIIRGTLQYQNTHCVWPPGLKRQTGGHWLRELSTQVRKFLGDAIKIFSEGFDELVRKEWVPVSRSKIGVALPQGC